MTITADTIADEQVIDATVFDLRTRENNVELIQLRARALRGQGRGDDVTEEMHRTARARCAEILNARSTKAEEVLRSVERLVDRHSSPDRPPNRALLVPINANAIRALIAGVRHARSMALTPLDVKALKWACVVLSADDNEVNEVSNKPAIIILKRLIAAAKEGG